MKNKQWSLFERCVAVPTEELEFTLAGMGPLPWSPFWLNPRQLRGSDFLMRWSQGLWSEERFIGAVNRTGRYVARPYGPSSVAPSKDVREHELYFERLERAGLGAIKRPDLLIFRAGDAEAVDNIIETAGGVAELPFVPEHDLGDLLGYAVLGIECENSLWVAEKMPAFGHELRPMRRLGGELGLPKAAVLPTVIVKEEDREPLSRWEDNHGTPIHVWHAFFDRAYGLSFARVQELIESGLIEPREQVFQAPGGSTTKKITYRIYYQYAYDLGVSTTTPTPVAKSIMDNNGHILPYVRYEGGAVSLSEEALRQLDRVSSGA